MPLLRSRTNAFASFLEKKNISGRNASSAKQNYRFCFFSGKEEHLWSSCLFCEAEQTLLLLFWKRRTAPVEPPKQKNDFCQWKTCSLTCSEVFSLSSLSGAGWG
jgi:hypothetical protein